jgi:D-amino peptidase
MRVYISVDMEGIGGINDAGPTQSTDPGYPRSVRLMVGEANAAIEGALDGGATDIVVNDSHAGMDNLTPADLHPTARLLQGQKPWSMVAGAQPAPDGRPSFDVALFVGYHARAGHPHGTIAHTYSGAPVETRLGGRPTGEYGLNAMLLGAWGVPVGMVAGDDALAVEVAEWLPWAERVIVKEATGTTSALSVHPSVACERVRVGAARAVSRAAARPAPAPGDELRLLEPEPPIVIEVEYARGSVADHAAILPGAERIGDRGVRYQAMDAVDAYRAFLAGNRLAGIVR